MSRNLRSGSFLVYFSYLRGENGPRVDNIIMHPREFYTNNATSLFKQHYKTILNEYVKTEDLWAERTRRYTAIFRITETDEDMINCSGFPLEHLDSPHPPEELIKFRMTI